MALSPRHRDPDIDRAAPADLDRIPQPIDRGGFADQTQIGRDAARRHAIDQRARAEDRRAFLVPGDDQADRARIDRDPGHGGDEGRDGAFHIDRAAPVEQAAAFLRAERIALPAGAGRHDIQMPCEGEMPTAPAARRQQVFDRTIRRFADDEAIDLEPERQERRFQRVEHRRAGRRDALTVDQRLGQRNRIGQGRAIHGRRHCPSLISIQSRNRTRRAIRRRSINPCRGAGIAASRRRAASPILASARSS